MRSAEITHLAEQPTTTLSRFITRAWEHPLLTEETKHFRAESLAAIQNNLTCHDISLKDAIAIPVGSFLWAAASDSDIDYVVIYKDLQGEISERKEFMRRLKAAEEQPLGELHLIKALPESGLIRERSFGVASALLLTPDDYLEDQGMLAPAMRLRIMDNFSQHPDEFWSGLTAYFDRRFRNWAMTDLYADKQRLDWKRGYRYFTLLEQRSSQTKTTQERGAMVWENAFVKAKDNFGPPGFYTYQNALIQTDGSLQIDSRLASTGILPSAA